MDIVNGIKKFEIRKDDRGYLVGDLLHLKELDDEGVKYTGFELFAKVIYIHEGLGMENGYVCMSIKQVAFV